MVVTVSKIYSWLAVLKSRARVVPLVGVDARGLDDHDVGRHVGLGCERRTAARAIAAQDPEPARTDVVEDAVSPMMFIALRCTKMTVEKALPDCGRQRLQWHRPAASGFLRMPLDLWIPEYLFRDGPVIILGWSVLGLPIPAGRATRPRAAASGPRGKR
jgi:hypothetical protein